MATLRDIKLGQTISEQVDLINENVTSINTEFSGKFDELGTLSTRDSLTATEVGAVPFSNTSIDNIDDIKNTGIYASNSVYLIVIKYGDTNIYQEAIYSNSRKFRRFTGTWSEWVECYTTEHKVSASEITGIETTTSNDEFKLALLNNGTFYKADLCYNPSTSQLYIGNKVFATKEYVDNAVNMIHSIIVSELPETGVENTIYFVPSGSATNNRFNEYVYVNDQWEVVGGTQVDLTPFITKEEVQRDYATKEYVNTNGGKIDKIKVNNVEQTITNKTVNISVPTKVSDLSDKDNYATTSWVEGKNYLTTHQDISGLATKSELEEVENSIPTDYIDSEDIATTTQAGIVKVTGNAGILVNSEGAISTIKATDEEIEALENAYKPIVPANLEKAVKTIGDENYILVDDIEQEVNDSIYPASSSAVKESIANFRLTDDKEISDFYEEHSDPEDIYFLADDMSWQTLEWVVGKSITTTDVYRFITNIVAYGTIIADSYEYRFPYKSDVWAIIQNFDADTQTGEVYIEYIITGTMDIERISLNSNTMIFEKTKQQLIADKMTIQEVKDYVANNSGKIDTIKVNGTTQTITDKAVDISIPDGFDGIITLSTSKTCDITSSKFTSGYYKVSGNGTIKFNSFYASYTVSDGTLLLDTASNYFEYNGFNYASSKKTSPVKVYGYRNTNKTVKLDYLYGMNGSSVSGDYVAQNIVSYGSMPSSDSSDSTYYLLGSRGYDFSGTQNKQGIAKYSDSIKIVNGNLLQNGSAYYPTSSNITTTSSQVFRSSGTYNKGTWEDVDTTPTDNSTKLITSGGVKSAISGFLTEHQDISGKQDKITSTNKLDYSLLDNTPTIPSISGLATESYVDTKVSDLVASSPETLDTLNELATALGNDPNFATTMSTELGKKANTADLGTLAYSSATIPDVSGKLDKSGGTMSGNLEFSGVASSVSSSKGVTWTASNGAYAYIKPNTNGTLGFGTKVAGGTEYLIVSDPVDKAFRPASSANNVFTLGTSAQKFKDAYLTSAHIGTVYENGTTLANKYQAKGNYLTSSSLSGYATETWVTNKGYSTFSGSYNDLTNKPAIPTFELDGDTLNITN